MRGYLLKQIDAIRQGSSPLLLDNLPRPVAGKNELLLRVHCCGVCHTELDEIEGRTVPPALPVIPGHQVVGEVVDCGAGVSGFHGGERVGVAWIYDACGTCELCRAGAENLCPSFLATGRDRHGGYAEYMVVPYRFVYRIPDQFSSAEAAPLLCGGAIGYRSLRLTGMKNGDVLALTGFGASAHIVLQLAISLYPESKVLVFARNPAQRQLAAELGAFWTGQAEEKPPLVPGIIIDTTPAWKPVLQALRVLRPGGRLVINAIRKDDSDRHILQELDYAEHLWLEKELKSVANITRADVREFLLLAAQLGIRPNVTEYDFSDANTALIDMKFSRGSGAKVLSVGS